MKLHRSHIDSFLDDPFGCSAILIHGNNSDRIYSYSKELAKVIESHGFVYTEMNFSNIINDPLDFENEMLSISLFGEKKVFLIHNTQSDLPKKIEAILENNTSNMVILTGEGLKTGSSVRRYFEHEKNKNNLTIAFYKDEASSLHSQIKSILKSHDATYTTEALDLLYKLFEKNSLLLRSEMDKLMVYSSKNITVEAIKDCISSQKFADVNDLANAILNKNTKNALLYIDELTQTGFLPVAIIRIVMNYFANIVKAKLMLDKGKTKDQIKKEIEKLIFFKEFERFFKNIYLISLPELLHLISGFLRLEIMYKSGQPVDSIYIKSAIASLTRR